MTGGSPGDVGLDNHQSQSDLLPVNPEIWWTAYPPPSHSANTTSANLVTTAF